MGIGGTEEHAVGHDDGGAATVVEQAQEKVQEQDFGFLDLGGERRGHVGGVDGALEGRIG